MKSRLVAVTVLGFVGLAVLLVLLAGGAPTTVAQAPNAFQPVVSRDIAHDTSAPLRDLAKLSPAPSKPAAIDAINKRRPNRFDDPKFLEQLKELGIDLETYVQSLWVPDTVVQNQIGVPYAPNAMPTTIHNFEGVSQDEMQAVVPGTSDNYIPPDPDGDIGYDPVTGKKYYVQYINTAYAIWDVSTLTPTRLITASGNALWAGFGGTCETSNDGDPIVLFDQLSNRWLMSQFALPGGASGFHQCIAISQSADPTGAWYRYDFLVHPTKLNDYPKFGVWPDAYYMTDNQFNSSGTAYLGAGALAFERTRMLQGLSAQMIYFDLQSVNIDFGGQLPSDLDGMTPPPAGAPNYFFEVDDDSVAPGLGPDAMRIWKFHVDWTTPANSTFGVNGTPNYTVTVSPFTQVCPTTRSCVPQPGTTARLDAISDRLMFRGAYRNIFGHETVVLNHTVDAGSSRAGVRWYEVRDVGTAPTIYQQGTYAPADGLHRWMASIAMDHVGNVAVGYSGSSASVFPSVLYAGRLAGDPLGVLAQGEASVITGTGSQTDSAARWGDYSAMTLDPVDDCTFWYTQEYYPVTAARDWHMRIASFRFPSCTLGPQGTLAGTVTNASNAAPIVGAKVDATLSPTQTFTAYSNPSGNYNLVLPVGTYTVTGSAYGFLPSTFSSVAVVSGTTTTQNISLTVAPTYVISGFVRDSVTNDPLWATVAVIGTPFNPPFASVQTDPATGFYSMTLAGGQSYTLTASALIHTSASQGVTPVSNQTVNFNLVATSQNGGIIGWVRNFYTNDPIAGATVQVAAPGNPQATTDATGYFQIFNLTPGFYTATASANLYSPVSISNIQVLTSNFAIRTFLLPTSRLNYAPASLNKTLTFGSIVTDAAGLVISNTGLGALTYELQEQPGGFMPLRPMANDFIVVSDNTSTARSFTESLTSLGYTYDVMTVANFNLMTPAALLGYKGVLYAGSNSGCSSCSLLMQYLDAGGRLIIADNDLGFSNGSSLFYRQYLEANYVADDATVDNGSVVGDDFMAGLSGAINLDPFPDQYTISGTNTIQIFHYSTTGPGNNGPAASMTTRNSYKAIYFAWDFYYLGTATIGEQIEKDVLARALGAVINLDTVPWISESPITGTLAQSATQNIQLEWNANIAAVPQPGTYTATLRIKNNDPVAQNTVLPVVMTVQPAANQGLLQGTVSSTGICDVNLAPINGAKVYLQGTAGFTQTLFTNAGGAYNYYLDQAQSPYTVTVSYADHPTTTVSVGITGGVTTTQNFTLRLQKSCINVDPKNLQATLQLGNATSRTLYLTSTGALPLDYNLFEVPASLPIGGGPDAFGYTWITSTYGWIDATGGTALGLADDGEANVTSPFTFPYYGGSATAMRVGNNGAVLYNATTGDVAITNNPMATAPDNFIAPFWDDIDDETGNVYWTVTGSSPNRKLVVEWYNRPHYVSTGGVGSATFEMVLFENGNILYQYQDVDFGDAGYNNGASATIGIRGVGAANSLQYSFNQPVLNANQAICFVRPGNPPCDAVDVPWLSESITSTIGLTGTPPTSQMINVTIDAAQVPLPGVYTANLLYSHNSPQPAVNIPVTLTVTAPPNYGTINGVVNGLAACDLPGAPLNGATVQINGGAGGTATTNASGQYLYSLIGNAGTPYTLTVSYAGYVSQSANITVTQGTTTTTNFNLRPLLPCASAAPSSLSATTTRGASVVKTLTVNNSGLAPLTFQLSEQPAAMILGPVTINLPAQPAVTDVNAKFNAATTSAATAQSLVFELGQTALAPNAVKVLLLTPDAVAGGDISLIQSTLAAYPDLQVTLWNGASGDPTAAQLAPYNVVVVGNDYLWNATGSTMTAAGVGNALADYIDAGGKVIDTCFLHSYDQWALAGRYMTGGYAPVTASTTDHTGIPYTLGTVFDPSHPIMTGVTTINDNPMIIGIGHQDVGLAAGATRLANWSDGDIFIAYKPNVVAVNQNWFHGSGWTGDVGKVMHNSIVWLGGASADIPWLSETPITGTVAAGGQQLINVTFTAAPTMTLGVYTGTLVVGTNDLSHANINVPVTFQVISGKLYLPLLRK